MKIDAPHFELEANFFSECMKKKIKLCEVPISYKRRGGKAKISVIDGLRMGFSSFQSVSDSILQFFPQCWK